MCSHETDDTVAGCERGLHGGRPCCRRAAAGARGALVEPAALAGLLNRAAHGYDLRREIREFSAGEIDVDAGGLYRVLRSLEQDGFVTSSWVEGESGPQRRDYEITAEGRDLAEDWVARLRERERISRLMADALEEGLRRA